MVTPSFLPEVGGVETHVYEVGRRLVDAGLDITVLCTDTTGHLAGDDSLEGMRIVRVPAIPRRRDYRLAPRLGRFVAEGDWDVVHVQSYHTFVAPHAMASALQRRIPYVLSFHAGGHSDRLRTAARPLQQRLLRPLIARAARLVVLARFEIELYGTRLRLPRDRFVSVPNGADLPRLAPSETPPLEPGLIASIGRLERYKGHHRVIRAMPYVLAARPDARLWIAGSGPYERALRSEVDRLGLSAHVVFRAIPLGDRTQMAREVSRAGLVVLLSDYETHPIAALEAIGLGRRVLVSRSPGSGELADRGLASAIPRRSSAQEIAAAVVRGLAAGPPPSAPQLPTWDDCAERLAEVYREIAGTAS
jgi:glycosyltransferase involved in cell wall biosynthesis